MRKLKVTLVGIALAFGSLFVVASPANAVDLSVNMTAACQMQYGPSVTAHLVYPANVHGWRCLPGGRSVNILAWCQTMYGSHTGAIWYTFTDPYSWRCRV